MFQITREDAFLGLILIVDLLIKISFFFFLDHSSRPPKIYVWIVPSVLAYALYAKTSDKIVLRLQKNDTETRLHLTDCAAVISTSKWCLCYYHMFAAVCHL